jgi:hypothetical protein
MYYPLNIGADGYQQAQQGPIASLLGQLGGLLPFQAGQQMAPQGDVGNILSQILRLLPFQAGQQMGGLRT